MDQWLKTGIVNKRKTTESATPIRNTQDMPSLITITNFAEENPKKKLPQVSDTNIRKYSEEYLSQGFSFIIIENIS